MKNTENVSKEIKELIDSGILLNDVPRHIEAMYRAGLNLLLWGDPGIGKTQMVEQFVSRMRKDNPKFGYHYYPLASKEPADLIGVPMAKAITNHEGKDELRTYWAIPNDMPTDPNWKGVMFFDEINNAPPAMQNAFQQLIQERRLGDYHLPVGAFIIAAGNPSGINAYSTEMQAPVKDRFAHKYVKTNVEIWSNYMLGLETPPSQGEPFITDITETKVRELLVAFMNTHTGDLFDSAAMNSNSYVFATPRSWERIIKLWGQNPLANEHQVLHFVNQYVGNGVAHKFLQYCKNSDKYQKPAEILFEGKDFRATDLDGFYGTFIGILSTLSALESDKLPKAIQNLIQATHKLKKADWQAVIGTNIAKQKEWLDHIDFADVKKIGAIVSAAVVRE